MCAGEQAKRLLSPQRMCVCCVMQASPRRSGTGKSSHGSRVYAGVKRGVAEVWQTSVLRCALFDVLKPRAQARLCCYPMEGQPPVRVRIFEREKA